MSGTAWLFVVIGTAIAAVSAFVLSLFNERGRYNNSSVGPVTAAVIAGIVMFFVNWLILYFGMPSFSWWSTGGWPLIVFLNWFVGSSAALLPLLEENNANGGAIGWGIGVVALIIWGIALLLTPPAMCDNPSYKQLANIMPMTDATSAYPNTDLSLVIRVPQSVALSNAGNALSSGDNGALGSYMQANRAYIQSIAGHPYYVVDLRVTDWRAFNNQGGVIPGYVLVDAIDPSAPVQFKGGYSIRYAPDAMWGQDLDRRVYMDYILGTPFRVADLDGMEVDDEFVPYYTGTMMRHQMGYTALVVDSLYQFDPQSGTGTHLTLDQKPAWLDRVYPMETFAQYAEWWGSYHAHDVCNWSGQAGMEMVDRVNDVIIPGGIEYQITMTSVGNDPSLTHLITVNPTTGQATLYPFRGKTIEGIEKLVKVASKKLNPAGYNAEDCEIHRLLDHNVAYCMLTFANDTNSGSTSNPGVGDDIVIGGYAFVDIESAMNNQIEDVAIGASFNEAYANFQTIVARAGMDANLANNQSDVQVVGTVVDNVRVDYPSADTPSFLITVQPDDGTALVYMVAPTNSLNAAIARQGSHVTATVYQIPGQQYFNVRKISVDGAPNLEGALYAPAASMIAAIGWGNFLIVATLVFLVGLAGVGAILFYAYRRYQREYAPAVVTEK